MNVKENRSLPTKNNIEVYSRGQHNKNVLQFFFMVLVQMENLAFQGVKICPGFNKKGNRNKSNGGETSLLIVLR